MDDVIKAIETSTDIFENAGNGLKLLVQSVEEFQNIKTTPEAVRQAAHIIRLLDVILPKLTPPDNTACQATSADVLKSMHSLSSLVADLSSKDDLYYSTHVRQSLKSSSKILSQVTNFLNKESHFKFESFCTKDPEHSKEFITAVGKMLSDLAHLYDDLGGDIAADQIRKQESFTKKIAVG